MTSAESTGSKPSPVRLLYAEELAIGKHLDFESYEMTADEIVAFGAKWDPLPLHLSEEHAGGTAFGRLVASGLHTMAVFQLFAVRSAYAHWDMFAGRRLDDVRWLSPVFPGDTLTGGLDVQTVVMTHPGRALVTCAGWLETERGRVLEVVAESYINRRP